MKKKNIKKVFNKKTSFALLLGMAASFSPLLVMSSCNVTTSQGDKNKNKNLGDENKQNPNKNKDVSESKDVLDKEIKKLTYTALSDEDFKNVTISDSTILDESVAEQLGFVLPDAIEKLIKKPKDAETPEYKIEVSKTKGSAEVTYKYQRTSEQKEKKVKVIVTSNYDIVLYSLLKQLKTYNETVNSKEEWKNISASGFEAPINGDIQTKIIQIKKIEQKSNLIEVFLPNLQAYIRKAKNEDTIKYVVVKTLDQGQKIIVIGEPVKVSPTK